VDPKAPIACPWCGVRYERGSAEAALRALRGEVAGWLQRTAGVAASDGEAVDVATRSFLFNDRILPGLRRDVRRAIDEGIGDVLGSPILVPPALRSLPGYTGEDCVLLTRQDEILALRSLRARLESPEVASFATTMADRVELTKLEREIDRALLASHATVAIATEGLAHGAERACRNLEALREENKASAVEAATSPSEAAVTRAIGVRCEALLEALGAWASEPVDADRIRSSGARLEEASEWLLSLEERDLRGALASTGLHRDAVVVQLLHVVVEEAGRAGLSPARVFEQLHAASGLLDRVERDTDAIELVRAWTWQLASVRCGTGVAVVTDVAWTGKAATQACRSGERVAESETVFVPYWAMTARHAKAEGFLFVSGKQYEGLALVPASADEQGTWLLGPEDHLARWVQHALGAPSKPTGAMDLPFVGPSAAREGARRLLRSKDLRNVSLGEARIVWLPILLTRLEGAGGARRVALSLMGPVAHDLDGLAGRAELLKGIADSL
jgi:hypothetical protein